MSFFLNLYLLSGWMMTPQNILLSSMSVALYYNGWSSSSKLGDLSAHASAFFHVLEKSA